MEFDDYQKETHQFILNDDIKYRIDDLDKDSLKDLVKVLRKDLLIARFALGLTEEAGEVAGKVKKYLRGDFSLEELKKHIKKESGDAQWYLSELNSIFGNKLSDIAQQNLDKLADRRKRGKIHGDGDDR